MFKQIGHFLRLLQENIITNEKKLKLSYWLVKNLCDFLTLVSSIILLFYSLLFPVDILELKNTHILELSLFSKYNNDHLHLIVLVICICTLIVFYLTLCKYEKLQFLNDTFVKFFATDSLLFLFFFP